jgi:hypothetical protein
VLFAAATQNQGPALWKNQEETMVEVETTPESDTLVVLDKGERLGTITFDAQLSAWIADAEGQSRACSSVESAVKFVEAVWQPHTEIKVVHS